MTIKPWIYVPDDYLDLGAAGEHPLTLTAWIDVEEINGEQTHSVRIVNAIVHVQYGELAQELDITTKILNSHYTRKGWEDEIWENYESKQKVYDEDVGA